MKFIIKLIFRSAWSYRMIWKKGSQTAGTKKTRNCEEKKKRIKTCFELHVLSLAN